MEIILINILCVLAAFVGMEAVAWLAHKYIMHGILWKLHKDHHKKESEGFIEHNDFFFLIFALPGIACLFFGMQNDYNFLFWIGVGITLYGLAYFLIHDIFIHQRFKILRNSDSSYFKAIRRAHKMHHKHLTKEDGECFGMLWIPLKIFQGTKIKKSNMKYTYLFVDFFAIIIPFLFSFHPNIKFYKTWKQFFIATIAVACAFIIWDAGFTRLGVWSFNPNYVVGIYFLKLPVEEIFFFICIPFSCVFTFYCLDKFYKFGWSDKSEKAFVSILFVVLMITALVFGARLYTSITFITTGFVCVFLKFIFRVTWFGKAISVYAILLVPFFIVNGILTGSGLPHPVVSYNKTEIMNIRLFSIPLEDVFYGLELYLLNLSLYKWLLKMKRKKLTVSAKNWKTFSPLEF